MKHRVFQISMIYMTFGLGGCGHDHHSHEDHHHGDEEPVVEVPAEPEIGGAHRPDHPGGFLVVAEDHKANIEVVPNLAAGEMRFYLYDGCAENPVRCAQEEVRFTVELDSGPKEFVAKAQANGLTGETVGDSSEFYVQDDALKGHDHVAGEIDEILFLGTRHTGLAFDTDPATHDEGYYGEATEHGPAKATAVRAKPAGDDDHASEGR